MSGLNKANPWAVFMFFFFYCLLSALTSKHFSPPFGDLAEYLNNPLRILHGEMPYRDFWLLFPPGEVYAPALVYWIFGIDIDLLRNLTIFFSAASCGWAFWLGRILFGKNSHAVVVMLLYFFTSVISQYIGPDYLHAWLVLLTTAVCFLGKYFIESRRRCIFIAGLFCGTALLFRFYESAATCLAMGLTLLYWGKTARQPWSQILRPLLIFCVGIGALLLLFALVYPGSILLMVQKTVIDSYKNGVIMGLGYFHTFLKSGKSWLHSLFSLSTLPFSQIGIWRLIYEAIKLPVELLFYLIPFISIGACFFFRKLALSRQLRAMGVLFFLWGLSLLPKGLGRPDLAHMSAATMPFLFFLFIIAVSLHQHRPDFRFAAGVKRISVLVLVLMLSLGVHPLFKTVLLAKELPYYGKSQRGTIAFRYEIRAQNFAQTVAYIDSVSDPEDYIFVTSWYAPPLYALCNRRNPTAYDSMIDLFMRDSNKEQKIIIDELLAKKTKLIIHDPEWGFDEQPDRQFRVACKVLDDFIQTQCVFVKQIGRFHIFTLPGSGLKNDDQPVSG